MPTPIRLCLTLLVAVFLGACSQSAPVISSEAAPESDQQDVLFHDVQPILTEKFAPLLVEEPGLRLDTWEHLLEGSEHGGVLIPFDPERSLLVELATQLPADHPLRPAADRVSDDELVLVRRWIEQGARSDEGEVAYSGAGPRLYVANQGAAVISVIDMERNVVIRTVDLQELGFSENAKPHHVAVEPDGAHWYVSLIGANRVLKFDRENELVGQAELEVPGMLALDPSGDLLWVGRSMSAVDPPQRLGVIDRTDMSVDEVEVLFPRPHALALAPTGAYAFAASLAQNQIAVVDTRTYDVELTTLEGPAHTFVQFAVAPDGGTMVAGGQMSGDLLFFDTSSPMRPVVTGTVRVDAQPWHPIYTPDGRSIYFGNKGEHAVTVMDADRQAIETVIRGEGLAEPHGSTVRPDGRYVYISNNNRQGTYTPRYDLTGHERDGTVVVIDTQTNEIVKVIEVEQYPSGAGSPAAN